MSAPPSHEWSLVPCSNEGEYPPPLNNVLSSFEEQEKPSYEKLE